MCGGQGVIRGTRVPLRTILASLAEGATANEIVSDFPTVSVEAVQAVIACARSHSSICCSRATRITNSSTSAGSRSATCRAYFRSKASFSGSRTSS